MRLVFLHGPAAAGKYTVAKELAALTGYRLYHNHLVVDDVLQRHAFGTPGFIAERDQLWREYLTALPASGSKDVIFTFNPENSVPQAFIDWLFTELPQRGVKLFSVELTASEAAIEARLGADSRRQFRKLVDLDLYRRLRDAGTFATPVIPRVDLRLDSERLTPVQAAQAIARAVEAGPAAGPARA